MGQREVEIAFCVERFVLYDNCKGSRLSGKRLLTCCMTSHSSISGLSEWELQVGESFIQAGFGFLGAGTKVALLRQVGVLDWLSDMLSISVKTSVNCSVNCLS